MQTRPLVANEFLSDKRFYTALAAAFRRLLREYLVFAWRFIYYFPSILFFSIIIYILYHPAVITTLNDSDALLQFSVDLNESRCNIVSFLLHLLNCSFAGYIVTFKLKKTIHPVLNYFSDITRNNTVSRYDS